MSRVPFYCGDAAQRPRRRRRAAGDGRRARRRLPDRQPRRPALCLGAWAIEEVIQRARRNGIAFAGIRNSAHVGVLGIHLLPVAEAGLVGFAFTNSPAAIPRLGREEGAVRHQSGGRRFPAQGQGPARDRPRADHRGARQDHDGDAQGRAHSRKAGRSTATASRPPIPKEAIEHGSLFPIGGAKGAMLALMFELICAALTGAAIGPEADSFFSEEGNKPRIGQAFIAIDPAALAGMEKFSERVETVVAHHARRSRSAPARRAPLRRGRPRAKKGIEVPDDLHRADREAMYDVVVDFPKMKVGVKTRDERVVEIRYLPPSDCSDCRRRTRWRSARRRQLERYREDPDTRFDLPLLVEGTPLQRGVWDAMCAIPRGKHAHLRRARARARRGRARHRPGLRRQPAADRHSLPPRGRGRRHRRLRALDRRLPAGGEALAADARGAARSS